MIVTVVISKDRTDKNPTPKYRFAFWDENGGVYGQGRASQNVSGAKKDVERLTGPLQWTTDVDSLGIEARWVLQAALFEVKALPPVWPVASQTNP